LALFAGDLCWRDATRLAQDKRTVGLADQLFRAVGSVSANIAEGYSRSSGKDRARFFEYALGSAREARGWYHQGRHILSNDVAMHRIKLMTQIIRLLLTMIPIDRGRKLTEERASYDTNTSNLLDDTPMP
jgi:four helix bundle protein